MQEVVFIVRPLDLVFVLVPQCLCCLVLPFGVFLSWTC